MIISWCKYYPCTAEVPPLVSLQFLWYNSYTKIDNKFVCYKDFADKNFNYINNLFDENGELKSWQKILSDFQLTQKSYFIWFQLIYAIPGPWKLAILNDKGNCKNIYLNHRLINNNQILAIEKPIALKNELPTSRKCFCNIFPIYRLNGKRFISYHIKFQLTPIYICFNIKY